MSSLVVNTNVDAIFAFTNLNNTDTMLSGAIQKLSTGLQVESSKDNPAAYSISQFLTEQVNGLTQASQNAQTGVNVLGVAAAALQQIGGLLQQMDTLAVSSANGGTTSAADLAANQAQFSHLRTQIDQIASSTQFNGLFLLNGSYANATFQIGAFAVDTITIGISAACTGALALGGASVGAANVASFALASVQAAITTLDNLEAQVGATQDQLQNIVNNLTVTNNNLQAANSALVDVNMAQEMTVFTTDQILMQTGTAMLSQSQQNPSLVLKLLG